MQNGSLASHLFVFVLFSSCLRSVRLMDTEYLRISNASKEKVQVLPMPRWSTAVQNGPTNHPGVWLIRYPAITKVEDKADNNKNNDWRVLRKGN